MTSVTPTISHPVAYPATAAAQTPSSHYDAAVAKIQQQAQQANQPVHATPSPTTASRGQRVNITA